MAFEANSGLTPATADNGESNRAQAFADAWIPVHINSSMHESSDLTRLTEDFVIDAQTVGLTKKNLQAAFGDLEVFISACIESANSTP